MLINEDLSRPVIVHASTLDWVPSPAPGVDRRMLYRVGGEVARATSIVRYAPGSAFPRHVHSGGEEILVLEGTFQDEHGDYPAGSYFRNPPGTSHVPASADGCTIFVRLWQFREGDDVQIVRKPGESATQNRRLPDGGSVLELFDDGHESVAIAEWAVNAELDVANPAGLEFLVLSGDAMFDSELAVQNSWGRLPAGTDLRATAGGNGLRMWLKHGPLEHPDVLPMPA
ncbi:cupin domain-containing protein [Agrobacterium sp. P15N1-A]|uniref:cupin domain-containing protein n=1 Tax=Agrobacterium sp. P15N1-A TaxID=3342820 RepID=UPI0037D1B98C